MEQWIDQALVISAITQETPLIKSFEIRSANGADLPAFHAGAHIKVQTPQGLVRKYSLTNDCAERDRYVIAVKREADGRGGSASLCDDAKIGDAIAVSEPVNAFELVDKAKAYVFIAGGIGITPLLSMIRSLGELPSAPWKLYYLTASREHTPFHAELASPDQPGKVIFHHTNGRSNNRYDLWPVLEKENTAHVYCCGSLGLMEEVRDMSGHWNPANIHFESFEDGGAAKASDTPFRVQCAKSQREFDVPVGQSILDVLRAHGIDTPASCESGTCGTCKTDLLAGAVDHRDFVLLDEEKDRKIMICVSRAQGSLIEIDR